MKKTRVILALIGLSSLTIFAFCFYYIAWLWSPQETGFLNTAKGATLSVVLLLTPFTFLSSATMFGFSFFRVRELPDGRLSYDPSNPYWKLMRKIFDFEKISLCSAFWMTAFVIFLASAGILLSVIVSLFVWSAYAGDMPKDFWPKFLNALFKGASWVSAIGLSLFAVCRIDGWRKGAENRNLKRFYGFLEWLIALVWIVVVPFILMTYVSGYDFTKALVEYLKGAGMFVGVAAAILFLGFAVICIYNFPDDSLIKRFWRAFKEKYCPILVAESAENKS